MGAVGFYYNNTPEFKGIRFTNVKNLKNYFEKIENRNLPIFETEEIDFRKASLEFTMLGLRKIDGINLKDYRKTFGKDFYEFFDREKINKLEKYLKIKENKIALKKNYFNIMNAIIPKVWDTMRNIWKK